MMYDYPIYVAEDQDPSEYVKPEQDNTCEWKLAVSVSCIPHICHRNVVVRLMF